MVWNDDWPVFVLNLKQRTDRARSIKENLDSLGIRFSFFEAVDGRSLGDDAVARHYDATRNRKLFKRPLSGPEIGCFLSHLGVWQQIVDRDLQGAIVLEDDARLTADFTTVVGQLAKLPLGPRIVKLDNLRQSLSLSRTSLSPGYDLVEPWIAGALTAGYVVPREAANILVRTASRFCRPVDIELKHWWEKDIRILSVEPGLVVTDGATASDLSASRQGEAHASRLIRFQRNLAYQGRLHAGLVRAHLRHRLRMNQAAPEALPHV